MSVILITVLVGDPASEFTWLRVGSIANWICPEGLHEPVGELLELSQMDDGLGFALSFGSS